MAGRAAAAVCSAIPIMDSQSQDQEAGANNSTVHEDCSLWLHFYLLP